MHKRKDHQLAPHVHRLTDGGLTGPSTTEGAHTHSLPGGGQTPSDQTGPGHNHGGGMGGPIAPPSRDDNERAKLEKSDMDKKNNQAELFEIKGVEIFAVGTWNGNTFKAKDLDEMVRGFNATKETLRPFLKLGHNENQKLLQKDGLPAAGWISALRRVGDKLVADFSQIPKKIFELIENRAFRNVSSEIYSNITVNGKTFSNFLSGVALLGTEMPAVSNLKDILSLYGLSDETALKSYYSKTLEGTSTVYKLNEREDMDTKALEKENADLKAKFSKQEAATAKAKADHDKAIKEADAAKKEVLQFKAEKEAARREVFISGLESKKLLTKATKKIVEQLIDPSMKEYSLNDKKLSRNELLEQLIHLSVEAGKLNFEAKSEGKGDESKKDSEDADDVKAINAIADADKLSFNDAARKYYSRKAS